MGKQAQIGVPSPLKKDGNFPPDIIRLLEILARIERRRQERLRSMRAGETPDKREELQSSHQ